MAKISFKRAAEALDAVRPGLSTAARQLLLGQAWSETKFGDDLPDGSNTNNWGSIGGAGDLGTYEITDTIEGKPIVRKVARFSTPEKGAEAFARVVLDRYGVGPYANSGDAWGYARALWRDGPNQPELGAPSKAPAYYTGFPPGHKYALAPAGVPVRSKLDDWYRVTAYARFALGGASAAAKALGETLEAKIVEPAKPDADSIEALAKTALGTLGDSLGGGGAPKKTAAELEAEAKAREAELAAIEERKKAEAEIFAKEREEQEAGVKETQAAIAAKEAKAAEDAKKLAAKGGTNKTEEAIPTGVIVVGVLGLAWLLLGWK